VVLTALRRHLPASARITAIVSERPADAPDGRCVNAGTDLER
jgi:hypothetical protein